MGAYDSTGQLLPNGVYRQVLGLFNTYQTAVINIRAEAEKGLMMSRTRMATLLIELINTWKKCSQQILQIGQGIHVISQDNDKEYSGKGPLFEIWKAMGQIQDAVVRLEQLLST
jgi:hypothetical protein